jgi:hypothetical protein
MAHEQGQGYGDVHTFDALWSWVQVQLDAGARMIVLDNHRREGSPSVRFGGGCFTVTSEDLVELACRIAVVTKEIVLLVVLCCHSGSLGPDFEKELVGNLPDSVLLVTNTIGSEMAWALQMWHAADRFEYQATVGAHLLGELAYVSATHPQMRLDVALAQASSRGGLGAELFAWGSSVARARPLGEVFRGDAHAVFPALRANEWFVCPSELVPCAFEAEPFRMDRQASPVLFGATESPVASSEEVSAALALADAEGVAAVEGREVACGQGLAVTGPIHPPLKLVDFAANDRAALKDFQRHRQYDGEGTRVKAASAASLGRRSRSPPGILGMRAATQLNIRHAERVMFCDGPLVFPATGDAAKLYNILRSYGASTTSPGADPLRRLVDAYGTSVVLAVEGLLKAGY